MNFGTEKEIGRDRIKGRHEFKAISRSIFYFPFLVHILFLTTITIVLVCIFHSQSHI